MLNANAKAKLITEWYNIFRQYPEVFPDAYFRFLKANLEESAVKGTYIYTRGVLLTWKQYKKNTEYAKANDYSLEKMVSANPGNGVAKIVMNKFLQSLPKNATCYLKVAAHNARAICFYKKNGFKPVKKIDFGGRIPGLLMRRQTKDSTPRLRSVTRSDVSPRP
jgi:ribosomal protein S18 acetylase RimI-like enzyme